MGYISELSSLIQNRVHGPYHGPNIIREFIKNLFTYLITYLPLRRHRGEDNLF